MNSLVHYLYYQAGIVYIEWIGLEKFSAVNNEKLVMIGNDIVVIWDLIYVNVLVTIVSVMIHLIYIICAIRLSYIIGSIEVMCSI